MLPWTAYHQIPFLQIISSNKGHCWINEALSLCGLRVWVIGLMKIDGVEVSTFSER